MQEEAKRGEKFISIVFGTVQNEVKILQVTLSSARISKKDTKKKER